MEKLLTALGTAFFETLSSATPDILFVKDLDGAFLYSNKAFERLYGYTLEQIRGKTDFSFMSEEEASYFAAKDREALAATNPVVSTAWQLNHVNEEMECYETIKSAIYDLDGRVTGLLGIGRNVTQHKRAEEALQALNVDLEDRIAIRTKELEDSNSLLRQTLDNLESTQHELIQGEQLASLGRLMTGLSHELNTPIGSAYTVASSLGGDAVALKHAVESNQLKKSELLSFIQAVADGASLINRTLNHASELISTFKQVGVDQASMQRREFDLAATVADTLNALGVSFKGSGIELVSTVPQGIWLDSFPGMVSQVLINLTENAKKHAFPPPMRGRVLIEAKELGPTVEISVRDNGVGIPMEIREEVFTPFFTTKKTSGGSGLGLGIVQSLVTQELCGTLRLESTVGAGSSFVFCIPKVANLAGDRKVDGFSLA